MKAAQRRRRLEAKLAEEHITPQSAWYWLSFIDPDLPAGSRFLGVAIVWADGPVTAVQKSHELDINPGGEVAIVRLPDAPPLGYTDRLLDKADAAIAGGYPDAN
jgi:hypothetical protein